MLRSAFAARFALFCTVSAMVLVGCETPPVPTVASVEMALTADFLTQNAPPEGFRNGVDFSKIEANVNRIPHSHYVAELTFDGTYSDTGEPVTGSVRIEVLNNELSFERQVFLDISGINFVPLSSSSLEGRYEGVRLGNDYYVVDPNRVCSKVPSSPVADLTASTLVGGVRRAVHTNARKEENGLALWEYNFFPSDVLPPPVQVAAGGGLRIASGSMWIAPTLNAVYSYDITFDADNVIIANSRQLSGQVRASYRLLEMGEPFNIPIPFGC
jgi:hypothetical protein